MMRKAPNPPPPKNIKRPDPPPAPPNKKLSDFKRLQDDIAKNLSDEFDISIEDINLEIENGFSYAKLYIEYERKRTDRIRGFLKPIFDKIIFDLFEEYNDKNKNT